ncbi:MAG: peptide/nickel transport system substrate-binding protein [Clostridiales bacterium]|jgi:peptide/nickel transport system substrate-binding protein/oligopeptide transport system substrate-binding protein|nr:peptide/nickel transport system substrate-binding protein [Clostridiales bacterium]MDN5298409.1 peptide/nickel transport system substrate-binding protein [Clostridiales bacterium]
MKKKLIALSLVAAMLFALTACGGSKSEEGASSTASSSEASGSTAEKVQFVVPYDEDPGTADVAKTTEFYALPLNMFDRLVESVTVAPGKSELVPGLAETWEVSDDGLVYTFHLRKGALFQNGDEVKAEDVYFTFDRMLDPATEGLNTDFFDMIKGAEARMNGEADSTEGIKIVDDYTLEITLNEPFGPFVAGLATPAGSVYCKKAVLEAGDQFGIDPALTVGSGPFKLAEWTVNDKIVLEAFDNYWGGRAQYDELVLKIVPDAETARMLFESGEIDVFNCDMARSQIPYFESNDKWKDLIVSGPRVGVYYICLNQSIEPLGDVRVRKALQMAIDRENMLAQMFYGKGQLVNGIMPPGLYGYNSDLPVIPYDPEAAKALLAEAGYPDGFAFEVAQETDSPNTLKINEIIQSDLAKIGVDVTITQLDESTFFGIRKTGELPSYYSSWSADFNDPDNFIYTFFTEKNAVSRSFNYVNADIQQKIEDARIMTNADERIATYQEIEKTIVHDDAAWIPLFELDHLFVVQPYVKNYKVAWNGWSDQSYYSIQIEK